MSAPTYAGDSEVVGEQLREFLRDALQEHLPFLKQRSVEEISLLCKTVVKNQVKAAVPQMEGSKTAVGLMKLPSEIRNRIFEPLLVFSEPVMVTNHTALEDTEDVDAGWPPHYWVHPPMNSLLQPDITRVSREIRAETLPVYYGANTFRAYVCPADRYLDYRPKQYYFTWLTFAKSWLETIGPENTNLIKCFEVRGDATIVKTDEEPGWRMLCHSETVLELDGTVTRRPWCLKLRGGGDVNRWEESCRRARTWMKLNLAEDDLLEQGLEESELEDSKDDV